jgi:hypothetical protein
LVERLRSGATLAETDWSGERLTENLGAVDIELSPDDLREIDPLASKIEVQGARLPEAHLVPAYPGVPS